jgi:hypothetical protein
MAVWFVVIELRSHIWSSEPVWLAPAGSKLFLDCVAIRLFRYRFGAGMYKIEQSSRADLSR